MKTGKKQSASLGGIARGIIERNDALKRYNENPNICKNCNAIISVKPNQKIHEVKQKKFCTIRCSAAFNNRGKERKWDIKFCNICKKRINYKSEHCAKCCNIVKENYTLGRTLGELKIRRNFNYHSWRSTMGDNAVAVFKKSGRPYECLVCGSKKKIHIHHIKSISSFPDNVLISEINDLDNLMACCPKHHRRIEDGVLKVEGTYRGMEQLVARHAHNVEVACSNRAPAIENKRSLTF